MRFRQVLAGCTVALLVLPGGATAQGLLERMLDAPDAGQTGGASQSTAQANAAVIAANPDTVWRGRWEGSCRLPKPHDMTIAISGDQLVGEIVTNTDRVAMFTAVVKPNGQFGSSLSGLADRSISIFGRVLDDKIQGSWTYPRDCGEGKFTLFSAELPPVASPNRVGTSEVLPSNEQSALLTSLYDQGLITRSEYDARLAKIVGTGSAPAPAHQAETDGLARLERLYNDGLITQAEYERKRSVLMGAR